MNIYSKKIVREEEIERQIYDLMMSSLLPAKKFRKIELDMEKIVQLETLMLEKQRHLYAYTVKC